MNDPVLAGGGAKLELDLILAPKAPWSARSLLPLWYLPSLARQETRIRLAPVRRAEAAPTKHGLPLGCEADQNRSGSLASCMNDPAKGRGVG